MSRVPISFDTGIRTFFCGPESFTPDLRPIVGPAPELRNYFVAAGLNSIGILTGGGIGRLVAHWIVDGDPGADVTGMHPARLQPYQANPEYRRTRTVESLGMVYQCHYPNRSLQTARGAKLSPLHARLAEQGAYFKDVSGWEGADWYAGPGSTPDPGPLTWGRPAFWSHWEAEHRACREGVIVMDMSFMSKFRVQGRDAGRMLDHISANAVDGECGQITYTQWLNERGLLEADLTVTKLDDEQFMVVATDTAHRHVEAHLRRHIGEAHAFVTDVTAAYAQINVQGPHVARAAAVAHHRRPVERGVPVPRRPRDRPRVRARVLCVRITYLGELGYELYVPAEQAVHVYDLIVAAGAGVRSAARRAEGARQPADGEGLPRLRPRHRQHRRPARGRLRVRDRVRQAGWLHRPRRGARAQAGRPAAAPAGAGAVPRSRAADVPRRGRAPDGEPVGYVRAASYGHTLGGAVGLAMIEAGGEAITNDWLADGEWTVEITVEHHGDGLAAPAVRPRQRPHPRRPRHSLPAMLRHASGSSCAATSSPTACSCWAR